MRDTGGAGYLVCWLTLAHVKSTDRGVLRGIASGHVTRRRSRDDAGLTNSVIVMITRAVFVSAALNRLLRLVLIMSSY